MQSMTGHGSGSARAGAATVVVELRAVNHRFLEVRARLSGVLQEHAHVAEGIARGRLERGHVEISGRVEGALGGRVVLDRDKARDALQQLSALRDEVAAGEPLPLSLLTAIPGLFAEQRSDEGGAVRDAVEQATRQACAALAEMRATEGRALMRDLLTRVDHMTALATQAEQRVDGLSQRVGARLHERVAALLQTSGAALDPGRLEHEIALLADRADVSEELVRLRSHCDQLKTALVRDEPIGRKLEFLLQEVGREVNTLGSKVADLAVTAIVIELKAELERMREQAQNVL